MHARQHALRNFEPLQNLAVPAAAANVVKQSARGVGRVGDVNAAAGEAKDQPGVDGAKGKLAAIGFGACAFDVVEQPGKLGAGEIRIEQEACARGDELL